MAVHAGELAVAAISGEPRFWRQHGDLFETCLAYLNIRLLRAEWLALSEEPNIALSDRALAPYIEA